MNSTIWDFSFDRFSKGKIDIYRCSLFAYRYYPAAADRKPFIRFFYKLNRKPLDGQEEFKWELSGGLALKYAKLILDDPITGEEIPMKGEYSSFKKLLKKEPERDIYYAIDFLCDISFNNPMVYFLWMQYNKNKILKKIDNNRALFATEMGWFEIYITNNSRSFCFNINTDSECGKVIPIVEGHHNNREIAKRLKEIGIQYGEKIQDEGKRGFKRLNFMEYVFAMKDIFLFEHIEMKLKRTLLTLFLHTQEHGTKTISVKSQEELKILFENDQCLKGAEASLNNLFSYIPFTNKYMDKICIPLDADFFERNYKSLPFFDKTGIVEI